MFTYFRETPIGILEIDISDAGLHRMQFAADTVMASDTEVDHPIAKQLERELDEYFSGARREFSVPLVLSQGDFAQKVLKVLREQVPFGKTVYYSDLAIAAGHPGAHRAVGNVMHGNPILLILPCHRVLPKSGGIGSYAGKEERKEWFLKHEGAEIG